MRIAGGWTSQGQSQESGHTHKAGGAAAGAMLGSLMLMPLAGAVGGAAVGSRPDEGKITVTWVRGGVATAQRLGCNHRPARPGHDIPAPASLASLCAAKLTS